MSFTHQNVCVALLFACEDSNKMSLEAKNVEKMNCRTITQHLPPIYQSTATILRAFHRTFSLLQSLFCTNALNISHTFFDAGRCQLTTSFIKFVLRQFEASLNCLKLIVEIKSNKKKRNDFSLGIRWKFISTREHGNYTIKWLERDSSTKQPKFEHFFYLKIRIKSMAKAFCRNITARKERQNG